MVVSEVLECLVCSDDYRVRVGVGVDSFQTHYFDCLGCEQPIGLAVRANPPEAHIETVENCKITKCTPEEVFSKTAINLHPNFCFPQEKYHDHKYFPSIEGIEIISKAVRYVPGQFFQDIATQFDVPNADNIWHKVKSIYELSNTPGKERLASKLIIGYNKQRSKSKTENCECSNYFDVLNEFYDACFYPRVNDLYEPIEELIDDLHSKGELDEFFAYYNDNLKQENSRRYTAILTSYFKNKAVLGQMMYRARVTNDGIDRFMVGSKNFEEIKLFYGDVYEALTTNFTVLALLNNLESGRGFSEFLSLTLPQYLKIDKAKKHNPFKENTRFKKFAEELDSSLRNGSHHASMWRDGEVIMYRSGGTGAERNISYSRYIYMCNILTMSLVALHMVELHIQRKYQD
ncbi:hypothetical protein [Vibrio neptunius]|uniref:hypothetical protein n=1 Tax=Vibrio neptunius TaxID=170651 RepID=UPI003CE54FF7